MFSQNINILTQNIQSSQNEKVSDIASKPILFANFLKDFSNKKGNINQFIDDPSTLINIPFKKYEPKNIPSEKLNHSKKELNSNLFELENSSQILKEEYTQKTQKLNSLHILFKKNEMRKKNFCQKKKNKNNKYTKIKNNIKDTQIKEEYESESDSVSIDEEENIIKSPLKNQDIISVILNNSELISNDNNNLLYEKLNNIDLNDLIISNDYNEKDIIFCSIKINSIFTYKECKVSFAIFSFDKNYKKDNCDYILYKLDSQKDEEFIQIIQKIKNSNSYQKCELLKRNIFSKEDSIIHDLTVYYLKKSLF